MSAIEERLTALERRECAPSKATVDAFRTKCLRVTSDKMPVFRRLGYTMLTPCKARASATSPRPRSPIRTATPAACRTASASIRTASTPAGSSPGSNWKLANPR